MDVSPSHEPPRQELGRPQHPPPTSVFEDLLIGCAAGIATALLLSFTLILLVFALLPRSFRLPVALVVMGLSIAVGWLSAFGASRRRRHWQRVGRGQCTECGYDLRASTRRCPECGQRLRQR